MNKTLHRKLTEQQRPQTQILYYSNGDALGAFSQEVKLLHKAAKELLQPRPEAIANLLKSAKNI